MAVNGIKAYGAALRPAPVRKEEARPIEELKQQAAKDVSLNTQAAIEKRRAEVFASKGRLVDRRV